MSQHFRGLSFFVPSSLACLFAATTFSACTTGQIGGEIEHSDGKGGRGLGEDASGSGCEVAATTPLGADEETPLGVTAQQLSEAIEGTYETSLSWGTQIAEGAELTPEAGETTVTIEIIPREDSATLVDLEVKQSSDSDDDRALIEEDFGQCSDEVRVVADVIVTSENGAFDDTFEAVFRSTGGSVTNASIGIVPGELAGSFDVTTDGNGEAKQTSMKIAVAFGTISGTVSGIWQEVHGDPNDGDSAVSGSPMTYARFPANGCQYGALIGEGSIWADAIADAVGSSTSFDLTWEDGEATSLSLEPSLGALCLEANDYEASGTIVGSGSVVVSSEDGRVDATWDIEVRASLEGDELTSLRVVSVDEKYEGYPVDEFTEATGISGVETDATDLDFEFSYDVGLGGEASRGSLSVFELVIPECARPDYEPEVVSGPDGGQGSDGCEGVDRVELETAIVVSSTPSAE